MTIAACALCLAGIERCWAQEASTAPPPNHRPPAAPNVLIILADDLGWGSVGCYGADPAMARTPNIDRLAREGRRFTDASCPSSVCTPTRYGLLTGRYCWRTSLQHGTLDPDAPLLVDVERLNLASLLKERGYATAAIGKWHLGYTLDRKPDFTGPLRPGPLQIGFDYHFAVPQNHGDFLNVYIENEGVYGLRSRNLKPDGRKNGAGRALLGLDAPERVAVETSQLLTTRAVQWIKRRDRARPFFLYFTPVAVHDPVTPSAAVQGTSSLGSFGDWIVELDRSVGGVLDALDQEQLADSTLVLFTSDNGGVFAPKQQRPETVAIDRGFRPNGPWRGGKGGYYEGGFRVPCLVRWPGHAPPGSVSNEMVGLVDTLATIAALVGAPLPKPELAAGDSFNLLPAWLDEPHAPIRETMITHSDAGVFAIRQGPWKYIEGKPAPTPRPKSAANPPIAVKPRPELYNLVDDPAETRDLAGARADIAARLQQLLDAARRQATTRGE